MKNALFFLLALSLSLFSCQKEDYAPPVSVDATIDVRQADRPFKGKMSFSSVSRSIVGPTVIERWEGSGRFTHLGNTQVVIHQTVTAGQLSSTIECTAANGDLLILEAIGGLTSLDPVTLDFTSFINFTINGGTGRFVDADGGGSGIGLGTFPNFPPGPDDVVTVLSSVDGTISF